METKFKVGEEVKLRDIISHLPFTYIPCEVIEVRLPRPNTEEEVMYVVKHTLCDTTYIAKYTDFIV